jgi:hypothetical protein
MLLTLYVMVSYLIEDTVLHGDSIALDNIRKYTDYDSPLHLTLERLNALARLNTFRRLNTHQPNQYEVVELLHRKAENRNDPDLVQAFLKKWWVESDFTAPNLPLQLR